MSTNYPASLDSFTNPSATDGLNSATVPHADQHANANDAIEAIEAKLGVDNSSVTTSIDYLLKSASSLDPGHVHSSGFQNSDTTVTVDAAVAGTTETALRSFTLPANSLRVGDVIRVQVQGTGDRTALGPSLTLRLRWGGVSGVVLASSGALAVSGAMTNDFWLFESLIHVRAIGSSGSFFPQSRAQAIVNGILGANTHIAMPASGTSPDGTTSAVTVATDVSKVLVLTAQWSSATASNVIRSDVGTAEIIRKAV